jgi:putrescine transport system substrate-binding protein
MKHAVRPVIAALSAAILLAACGGNKEEATEAKVLNVYNWSDYIDESVLADFQKETGIKVTYDVFDSNEVLETKLLAGSTGYDIVVPSANFLERQIKAGIFQTLDKTKLPNLVNMDPALMAKVARHDPDNAHSVNYLWGTTGLGFNVDKIAERMKDAPLDSFAMFYDPNVVSKFKDCGVAVLDSPTEVLGTVLIYLGKDPNSESPEDLAAAEKVLMSVRPFIKYVHSSKFIDDLAKSASPWHGPAMSSRRAIARPRRPMASRSTSRFRVKARPCSSTCWPSPRMPRMSTTPTHSSTT